MRTGLTISAVGHAALLLWSVLTFAAKPNNAASTESMPIDVISAAEFSQLTAGANNAPKADTSKPLVDQVGDRKPVEDPTAKLDKKEVKAADDKPPPPPEPKPPAPSEKKPPEPKRDLIADALKKDQAKKPEQKKAEAKAPPQPKREPQQPKFDPRKVEALLDKRTPQRVAATGDVVNGTVNLGSPTGVAAILSQTELDALRARLAQLWNPPAGASNPEELVVLVRIRLNPDGRLAGPPMVLTSSTGKGPLFAASRDGAIRAVFRGQPFDMLLPEHYDQWKDIEITFDPRDMIRG
jgi:colicin import membrane protein